MANVGNFPLEGVGSLINVTVAFPGEHWSDGKAAEAIVPGECVITSSSAGKLTVARATAAQSRTKRAAIALRTVQNPDPNAAGAVGPNEIMNKTIEAGEWVHRYYSGSFWLSLVVPASNYAPGDYLEWDPDGTRPEGKAAGTGAWARTTTEANAFFEVQEVQAYGDNDEVLLLVKSVRSQF